MVYGGEQPTLSVRANTVDSVSEFIYPGKQDHPRWTQRARGHVPYYIALEASAMNQLSFVIKLCSLRDVCPICALLLCGNMYLSQAI